MDKVRKCGVWIKYSTHFHRHVKRCGTTGHRVSCPQCSITFARRDDMKSHIKKKHPEPVVTKGFCCQKCKNHSSMSWLFTFMKSAVEKRRLNHSRVSSLVAGNVFPLNLPWNITSSISTYLNGGVA